MTQNQELRDRIETLEKENHESCLNLFEVSRELFTDVVYCHLRPQCRISIIRTGSTPLRNAMVSVIYGPLRKLRQGNCPAEDRASAQLIVALGSADLPTGDPLLLLCHAKKVQVANLG